jgi:hypothetical protein
MDRTAGERKSNPRKTRPEIVTGTGPIYGQLRAPVSGASHVLGSETGSKAALRVPPLRARSRLIGL